jgi:hypothetical protein
MLYVEQFQSIIVKVQLLSKEEISSLIPNFLIVPPGELKSIPLIGQMPSKGNSRHRLKNQ